MSVKSKQPKVKESEHEKALAEVAYRGWQREKNVAIPMQQQMIREFQNMDSPARAAQERGRAAASATQSAPLMPGGFNPNAGGSFRALTGMAANRGAAAGRAATVAQESLERGSREGVRGMIALGKGIQNRGLRGASQLARQSQVAQKAQIDADAARDQARGALLGIPVGFAANQYLGMSQRPWWMGGV